MASPTASASDLHFDNTLGAMYIGNLAAAVLFGVTSVQTKTYFSRFPKDPNIFKALMMVLWVLDFLHFVLISHSLYYYSVTNYMNPAALLEMHWRVVLQFHDYPSSEPRKSLGVLRPQVISLFEVYLLIEFGNVGAMECPCIVPYVKLTELRDVVSGGNVALALIIVAIALAVFVGTVVLAAKLYHVYDFLRFKELLAHIYFCLTTSAGADIIVTLSLCFYLSRQRSVFKSTQSSIQSLMMYSINAGVLTSLCALACLICYATMPTTLIYEVFYFSLPKLFLNSLLAMLNARRSLRDPEMSDPHVIPLSGSTSTRLEFRRPQDRSDPGIDIQIETAMDQKFDNDLVHRPAGSFLDIKQSTLDDGK
ncbi:hypothetical protein NLI96_g3072 [Meripilus lineatus]|uniref:DUF6534 domain-containing protein n=1 Tax=Meripilus lineatus TaxID=2056292 RepID=A0AAD5V9N4_9APHY|nr:hypothetical protein NLI96_g3072 [Physisporinus lineatus]